jgi:AcrR family transcriptional regulator
MLQLVSRQGYEASTVAEVISLIGMSRKTFYEQFEDRRGCFMWVCNQVASSWHERAGEAIAEAPAGRERTAALLQALFEAAVEQPGALRSVMLEAAVVRPGGLELRERAIADWSAMLASSLGTERGEEPLSPDLARALFGGIVRTLHSRLPAGVRPRAPRRAQLMDLVPQLADWVGSYGEHPPRRRENGAAGNNAAPLLLLGGRAPGTLALASRSNRRRGLPRGENPISRSFVVHSQRERILDAVANLSAAKVYANLTIPEIVQEAAVSVQAFYEHFSGKEDAFLVAYAIGHRRALVAFERAFESQQDWPNAVHTGLQALLGFFAAEPSFAHCALVDAPSASERAASLLAQGITAYVGMLELGYKELGAGQPPPPPIAAEAIACALHELCFGYVVHGRARELSDLVPEATFLALTPFIGGAAAAQVAGIGEQETPNGTAKKPRRRSRGRRAQS